MRVRTWHAAAMALDRWPVSVKGVILWGNEVVLLQNERGEWELPGGRLEHGESPEHCVVREIEEELGIDVQAERLLDVWVYEVLPGQRVLIVTYGCTAPGPVELRMSSEHSAMGVFSVADLHSMDLPEGYAASIRRWHSWFAG